MSDVQKALDHFLIKSAINDVVNTISNRGVPRDSVRSIITEFATKALEYALVERVQSSGTQDWKSKWASASLAIFIKSGGNKLIRDYTFKFPEKNYGGQNISDLLLNLATALAGVGQLIKAGIKTETLFY